MKKKNASFKWIIIGLVAAIVVVGALFIVKNAGIQQAVNPNADQTQQAESFEIDPNNPPEGISIMRNDSSSSAATGESSSTSK